MFDNLISYMHVHIEVLVIMNSTVILFKRIWDKL